MNLYTEFLVAFMLVFAVGYTLAYLPGMLKMKAIYKRNLLFLVSVGLVLQLGNGLKLSYLWAVGFIFLIFNLYLFYTNKRRNLLKVYYAVIDFIVCSLTLFLSACIVAEMDDIPIKQVVHQRFPDGSYTFSPGYLDEMIVLSIILSLLIVIYKYLYIYLLKKWEERQNRKYRNLQYQKRNIETQFEALQAKVNPHFLYNSLTISFKSVLMKGSPPVIFVKYILGSFLIVSIEISSSGFDGALYLLHIEHLALHR